MSILVSEEQEERLLENRYHSSELICAVLGHSGYVHVQQVNSNLNGDSCRVQWTEKELKVCVDVFRISGDVA